MLDSIYHMTLKLLLNHFFALKMLRFCHIYAKLLRTSLHSITKLCNRFNCMVLFHSKMKRHMINTCISQYE